MKASELIKKLNAEVIKGNDYEVVISDFDGHHPRKINKIYLDNRKRIYLYETFGKDEEINKAIRLL